MCPWRKLSALESLQFLSLGKGSIGKKKMGLGLEGKEVGVGDTRGWLYFNLDLLYVHQMLH